MQQTDVKMFADEIARLEVEAAEAQQMILTQTERLRALEQRISALKSVVAGTHTRMAMSAAGTEKSAAVPEVPSQSLPIPTDPIPAERAEVSTALFGRQRAALPEAVDVGAYRAASSPLPTVTSFAPTTPPVAPAPAEPGEPASTQPEVPKTKSNPVPDNDLHLVDRRL